ncbi:MAG TPA: cytochrome c biogenesis protein CcdA, partial [Kiritimatiellia bacterium]|nr:cytochrome c biogenesis protein CcdA [Kiritimatiellia bacterium]
LPMIPINLAIIGAAGGGASRRARFGLGLVYGLGLAFAYGALGLVVVLTGSVFGAINSSPVFNGAIAILFVALALAMFDVWQLDFSRFRTTGGWTDRARLPAIFAMGGLSAVLAGACVAPVLVAVLALSGSLYAQGVSSALALPFLLGVGMALPWPLAAAGLAILPKPGAWMEKVKKVFGVLILLLAAYYAWNAFSAFRAPPAASGAAAPATASAFRRFDFGAEKPEAFAALLAEAAASGKPVLLDFGAHWCKVCKLMDATTLRDPAVVEKLGTYFPIQVLADEPNVAPARAALAPFALQGYPTFLLYPAP